jgi:hypothetical protein
MHDAIDGLAFRFVLDEQVVEELVVEDVALVELDPGIDLFFGEFLGQYEFDPGEDIVETVGHIVDNDHLGCRLLDDADDGVGTDESQSPRHQQLLYLHMI